MVLLKPKHPWKSIVFELVRAIVGFGLRTDDRKENDMTSNQIAFWTLQETQRHQSAVERETERHNKLTREEIERSNRAREYETNRSNIRREDETRRNNDLINQLGRSQLRETNRHNLATERLSGYQIDRNYAINKMNADTNRYTALNQASINRENLYKTSAYNMASIAARNREINESVRSHRASERNTMIANLNQRYNFENLGKAALMNANTNQAQLSHNVRMDQYYGPSKLAQIQSGTALNDASARYNQIKYELYPVELGLQAVNSGISSLRYIKGGK